MYIQAYPIRWKRQSIQDEQEDWNGCLDDFRVAFVDQNLKFLSIKN
jgi:hypothetical protein